MKNIFGQFSIMVIIVVLIIGSNAVYTVDETEQVVVTQFGEPIGAPITASGLKFKIPFVQKVNRFEKRLLQWDGEPTLVNDLEKRYIWIDITARWRISDALKFLESMEGSLNNANEKLDKVVNAGTRDIVRKLNLAETVRNSNRLLDKQKNTKSLQTNNDVQKHGARIEEIEFGRDAMTRKILKNASVTLKPFGIELVDVLIKRINYRSDLRKDVYARMISEREQAAEEFRSEGLGEQAKIEGRTIKELNYIRSKAYKKVQKIKGEADAKAIKIYADAYNNDPQFYTFLKTLETYKKTINKDTVLILSADSDYYHLLQGFKDSPLTE